MMDGPVPFGSREYVVYLALLVLSRGADFLSTWIATPNLLLEANPIARALRWRWGVPVNLLLCALFAFWPLPAIIISTTSVLVASRNFQVAWVMRAAGEEQYRLWIAERLDETPLNLFLLCLLGQTVLVAAVGCVLVLFSRWQVVSLGIGFGMVAYALVVLLFSIISLARRRRRCG